MGLTGSGDTVGHVLGDGCSNLHTYLKGITQRKVEKWKKGTGEGGPERGVEGELKGPSIHGKASCGRTEHELFGEKGSKRH